MTFQLVIWRAFDKNEIMHRWKLFNLTELIPEIYIEFYVAFKRSKHVS